MFFGEFMKKREFNKCPSGKNTYDNEEDAKRAVRDSLVLRDVRLNYYFCMLCFNYHMTSKLKDNKK